ncbi:MAG: hypothetical protein FWG54_02735 [Bacteroidetes bacterium]|nr:hypothetical protein [Bacteroidota bacterium]
MNDYVKNEWGLSALEESAQKAIDGGYVQPTPSNVPGYDPGPTIIEITILFW